jgi:hypothetical protein
LAEAFFGGRGRETWILLVQPVVMAAIGAGVTTALPALPGAPASASRRVLVWAGWGPLAALLSVLAFWLLLNGFRGRLSCTRR